MSVVTGPNSGMSEQPDRIASLDWNDVQQALITAMPTCPQDLKDVAEPGVYAWWDPNDALAAFWPEGFPQVDPTQPLYVVIAKTTLTERAVQMHLKTTRMSTIRRSLSPNNPTGEMSKKFKPFLHFDQYYVCTRDGSDSTDCRSTYE